MDGTEAGRINLGLSIDQSMFNSQLRGIAKSAQNPVMNAFKPLGRMIGMALGVGALTKFTKECLNLGSDLTEVQNVVDTTFKTMNRAVNEFAATAMTQFGLSETVAKQYMGTLGAMSKSMGFTEAQSYEMAEAVTKLTGDVASFYNLSTDESFNKLKSIWTGETETLKSIGVLLTQTNLDQYALNNGWGRTTASMTEQEKVMLRYQYTLAALGDASGDFAKTSGSWANQTRILSLQFESLKATLGQGFINLFTPIIQAINALLAKLQTLAQMFKSFTQMLMGDHGGSGGGTTALGTLAADSEAAVGGLGGVTGAAKAAAKAVGLISLDELNVLPSQASGAGTAGMGSIATDIGNIMPAAGEAGGALGELDERLQWLVEDARKFKDKIVEIATDFKVGDFFKAGQDISDLISGFFNIISNALAGVKWKDIGNKIGQFLRGLEWLKIMESLGSVIWEAVKGAAGLWFGMFEEAPIETALLTAIAIWKFTSFGKAIGDKITAAIPSTFTKNIGLTIVAATLAWDLGFDLGKELGKLLFPDDAVWYDGFTWFGNGGFFDYISTVTLNEALDAFGAMLSDLFKALGEMLFNWDTTGEVFEGAGYLFGKIGEDFKKGDWGAIGMDIVGGIVGGITGALSFITEPFTDLFNWVVNGICGVFGIHSPATEMMPLGGNILSGIVEGFSGNIAEFTAAIQSWWDGSVAPWFTKEKWTGIFENIKSSLIGKWEDIKSWWASNALVKWWNESVAPWFTKEKWSTLLQSVPDAFESAFKTAVNGAIVFLNNMLGGVESLINGAMSGFQGLIDLANKIPGVDISLSVGNVSLPRIPKLAEGGYVGINQPQLAMIGDNRHYGEIVAPENKIYEMSYKAASDALGQLLDRLAAIMGNSQDPKGDIIIPVYIGSEKIDEIIITAQDRRNFRSGGR